MRVLYGNMWVDPIFKMMSYPELLDISNGCGKAGITSLTPNSFFGLNITRC